MNRSCIVFVTYIYKYTQHTVLQFHTTSSNFIATQLACHILIVTFGYFLMFGSLLKWTKAGVALLGQFRSAGHWWEWLKFPGRNSSEGTYAGTTATLMKIMYMLLIQKEFCEVDWGSQHHESIANISMVTILFLFISMFHLVFRIWATRGTRFLSSTVAESLIWKHEERKLIIL